MRGTVSATMAHSPGAYRAFVKANQGQSSAGPALVRVIQRTLLNGLNANVHGGRMLRYAAIFLVIAIVAAVFGFGGIAVAAAGIAKILFFVFLILFLVSLISGLGSRRHV